MLPESHTRATEPAIKGGKARRCIWETSGRFWGVQVRRVPHLHRDGPWIHPGPDGRSVDEIAELIWGGPVAAGLLELLRPPLRPFLSAARSSGPRSPGVIDRVERGPVEPNRLRVRLRFGLVDRGVRSAVRRVSYLRVPDLMIRRGIRGLIA